MKLQSNKGNVFTIVIIVLALFTVFVGTIFMQINNQIKSNKNTLENTSAKYAAEAGIENLAIEIINQIESKVNSSKTTKSSYVQNKYTYDEFAVVKNQLIKVRKELLDLDKEYNVFDSSNKKLYNVIYNNYTSADIFKNDINEIKWNIIQLLAYQNDSVKNNIKSKVYSIINDINNAQINLYGSSQMHEGEEHKGLYIKIIIANPWYKYVDSNYINENFIGNYGEPYDYKLESIRAYTKDVLKLKISELKENINKSDQYWKLQDELQVINDKVESDISNELITINNNFNELRNLQNDGCSNDNINSVKSKLCKDIDNLIKNKIENIENELYLLYIEQFEKYEELNIENFELLKQISRNIDKIKINLIELKCKLGFAASNIGGEITSPDEDPSDPSDPSEDINNPNKYIEVYEFEVQLDENYSYKVNKIDKTPINIIYNSGKISSVDNIELELISTGDVQGKTYTIKAIAEFITTNQDNRFITNYSIKSYEKE